MPAEFCLMRIAAYALFRISGLLGAIAVAVGTGRRLSVAPQQFSYIQLGFNFPFDTSYTGNPEWLSSLRARGDHSDPALPFDHCMDLDEMADNRSAFTFKAIARRKALLHRRERREFAIFSLHCQRKLGQAIIGHWNRTFSSSLIRTPNDQYPFKARYEFFYAGNAGRFLFERLFSARLAPRKFLNVYYSCALQHWLSPSSEAAKMRDALRPSWGVTNGMLPLDAVDRTDGGRTIDAKSRIPIIGIHIRANGHLFNKRAGNNFARYDHSVLRQNDIGLGGIEYQTHASHGKCIYCVVIHFGAIALHANPFLMIDGCASRGADDSPVKGKVTHDAADFNEFWETAHIAEHALALDALDNAAGGAYRGDVIGLHSRHFMRALNSHHNNSARTHVTHRVPAAHWLLVSDSISLKRSAQAIIRSRISPVVVEPCLRTFCLRSTTACQCLQASWAKDRLRSTATIPSHVLCSNDNTTGRLSMLETLGELLLLSESDVLVHGRSRFPLSALYLCSSCRQSLRVDIIENSKCETCDKSKHAARLHGSQHAGKQGVTDISSHVTEVAHRCARGISPWSCRPSEVSQMDGTKNISYYSVAQELFVGGEWSYDALQ